jgi:hypothetical protein
MIRQWWQAGLPEGVFAHLKQKQIWYILKPWNKNLWLILWSFGF